MVRRSKRTNGSEQSNTSGNTQEVIPSDLNHAQRLRLAYSLRLQRLTYEEIAIRCGYANKGAARNAIKRETAKYNLENTASYIQQELAILDAIHQKVWVNAFGEKDNIVDLWSIDRLLALSDARRKMLGLDAPPDNPNANQVIVREVPQGYGIVEAKP